MVIPQNNDISTLPDLLLSIIKDRNVAMEDDHAMGALVRISRVNNLSGFLAYQLEGKKNISRKILTALRKDSHGHASAVLLADRVCQKVSAVLKNAAIPLIPLKGALFRHLIYPDPSMRPSVDIDLLVPPGRMVDARQSLEDAGLEMIKWSQGRRVSEESSFEHTFVHPSLCAPGCAVEIHDGYCRGIRYPVKYGDVWARTLLVDELVEKARGVKRTRSKTRIRKHPFGHAARSLSPEDTLVYLFIHQAKHLFNSSLLSFIDIKLLIEKFEINWEAVIERARETRSSGVGYMTLKIARETCGAAVPEEVISALRPPPLRRAWLEALVSDRPVPSSSGDAPLRFVRLPENLLLQEALLALPLIDGLVQPTRFATGYLVLRIKDLIGRVQ